MKLKGERRKTTMGDSSFRLEVGGNVTTWGTEMTCGGRNLGGRFAFRLSPSALQKGKRPMPKQPISFANVGGHGHADDLELVLSPSRIHPMDIQITRIEPNPYQARREFDQKALDELAQAIGTHGFQSRLRVRPHPTEHNRFQLIYGERRLRAAEMVGLTSLPCDVVELDDRGMKEVGLLENLHRQDLQPLEEARAFRTLIDEDGYTMESLGRRLGKSKGYIQNRLEVLRQPQDVQHMVESRPDTIMSAPLIGKLPEADRQPLIAAAQAGMPYKEVKQAVQTALGNVTTLPPHETAPRRLSAVDLKPGMTLIERTFDRWGEMVANDQIDAHDVIAAVEQLLGKANRLLRQIAE
jgi:ParB family chromosome partitioning protein